MHFANTLMLRGQLRSLIHLAPRTTVSTFPCSINPILHRLPPLGPGFLSTWLEIRCRNWGPAADFSSIDPKVLPGNGALPTCWPGLNPVPCSPWISTGSAHWIWSRGASALSPSHRHGHHLPVGKAERHGV